MTITKPGGITHTEQAKRLAAAVTSGLIKTLRDIGPFTVFAPTSQAFATIDEDINTLLKPENKTQFTRVLKGHIVAGKLMADTFKDGQELTNAVGEKLMISIIDGKIMVGGATVTCQNVAASNGIIHVIDKVMMPCW